MSSDRQLRRQKILHAFRRCVIKFIDDVAQVFPTEHLKDLILIKTYLYTQSDEHLIKVVSDRSVPHKDKLEAREEEYFNEHALDIFGELPKKNVEIFRAFVLSTSKKNRDHIWSYIDALISLSEEYLRNTRTIENGC